MGTFQIFRVNQVLQARSVEGMSKPDQYSSLLEQAKGLMHGEPERVANAANLAALCYHALDDVNWFGFYFWDGRELVVGPFQGRPACVRIALGKGVCGTAAMTRETQVVGNVDAFPGHIPCDSASRSEIVVPLVSSSGELIGVLDVDSPLFNRFDDEDRQGLEALAASFVEACKP
jgi:L-methionine (R)-S-oxide reductase